MNKLIEQLGGYEKAKEHVKQLELNSNIVTAEGIKLELLQYRRENGFFEQGDYFFNYGDDCIYVVLSLNGNGHMHGKFGDKNVWTYFGRFGLRHATDAEIKAGRRLEDCRFKK